MYFYSRSKFINDFLFYCILLYYSIFYISFSQEDPIHKFFSFTLHKVFKSHSFTVLCTTIVNETIRYYYSNGAKPVYLLLLDASKAFDKVSFYTLFNMLLDLKMCPHTVKLLHYMYTNQSCYVNWSNNRSETFKISNGAKQGGVISP